MNDNIEYILFYDEKKRYGWGSNFYEAQPLNINGEKWRTTEQYFQAMKFRGKGASPRSIEYSNLIKEADTPMKVKSLGTQKKHFRGGKWKINKVTEHRLMNDVIDEYKDVTVRPDWERVKNRVMTRALVSKFSQPALKKAITSISDNALMVEHTTRDKIWADGGDGGSGEKGQNRLGKILTALSHILKYGDTSHMSPELRRKVRIE